MSDTWRRYEWHGEWTKGGPRRHYEVVYKGVWAVYIKPPGQERWQKLLYWLADDWQREFRQHPEKFKEVPFDHDDFFIELL